MAMRVRSGADGAAAPCGLFAGVWPLNGPTYHSTPKARQIPAANTAFFTIRFSYSERFVGRFCKSPEKRSDLQNRPTMAPVDRSLFPAGCRLKRALGSTLGLGTGQGERTAKRVLVHCTESPRAVILRL